MTTIYAEPIQEANSILSLVKAAVDSEVARLSLALEMAEKRLAPFELQLSLSSCKYEPDLSV